MLFREILGKYAKKKLIRFWKILFLKKLQILEYPSFEIAQNVWALEKFWGNIQKMGTISENFVFKKTNNFGEVFGSHYGGFWRNLKKTSEKYFGQI